MAVKPGDILHERYRIDALIGRGGMGHVFAATDLEASPRVQVAIKVVSRLLVDEVMMARLQREAEAARRIQSEFVPHVIEVADTPEGETFLVMERLIGEPLSQRIRGNGAIPWPEVARTGEDVLRGLIDAHAAGIVHRDLKPSNVFLALKTGRVRAMVLDFGVCKMEGVDAERLTGTGESIGTVAYMAPEQIRGAARVDERADLYAFGVLVFEMLSGRLPHEGPSQMAILASKLENPASRLRDCSAMDIPEGVDELVDRALARDPAARFASAKDVLDAWNVVGRSNRLVSASMPPPAPAPPRALPDDVTNDARDVTERSQPRRLPALPPIPLMPTLAPIRPPAPSSPPSGNDLVANDADMAETDRDLTAAAGQARSISSEDLSSSVEPSGRPEAASVPIFARTAPDPHGTQTALATHTGGRTLGGRSTRLAIGLAACALVAGVVVIGAAFTRSHGPSPAEATGAMSFDPPPLAESAPPAASENDSAPATVSVTAPIDSSEAFELPPEPAPTSGSVRPRPPREPSRVRVTRPPPPAPSKGPAHGITTEPRY